MRDFWPKVDFCFHKVPQVFIKGVLIFFCLFTLTNIETVFGESSKIGARGVTVPKYDENGEIIWTLRAQEVSPQKDNSYFVIKPLLKTLGQDDSPTNASAQQGMFFLNEGRALGEKTIKIDGDGFLVRGEDWNWEENTKFGKNKFSIGRNGFASFEGNIAQTDRVKIPSKIMPESRKAKDLGSLNASATSIELLSIEKGGHEFIFEGNVSIIGDEFDISCGKMKIIIDQNGTDKKNQKRRISTITASGIVRMKQLGRTSISESLVLDALKGEIVLEGNAKVEDSEWGTVTGNRIFLDRESSRARVLGGENERPRILIPNLDKISLPSLKK